MRRLRRVVVAAAAVGVVLAGFIPAASADEVDDLIAVVERKPAGVDEDLWKEDRREAAKKLGKLGDKRAVPALIKVVETETFDVVAEYAIESLGKLGDKRAVPALEAVAADKSRDRYARNLARKALKKLGASGDGSSSAGGGGGTAPDGGSLGGGLGGDTIGSSTDAEVPDGPTFSDDTLGATEIFQLAAGNASLTYDSVREIAVLDGEVSARYRRTLERKQSGHSYGARASVAGGVLDLPGDGSLSRALATSAVGDGEARFYLGDGELYVGAAGALGFSLTNLKVIRPSDPTLRETLLGLDLHAAVGVGHGRILDLGEALRLRRIELALDKARVLGRPITADLSEKILRTWWALRDERGAYKRLLATVKILREAGVLLGEPDAATSYKIIQILLDGQLDHRLSGLDIRVSAAETYAIRDDALGDQIDGRTETALVKARYGMQAKSTLQELVGEGFARIRFLGPDDEPAPWAAGAAAAWRRFVYGDYEDPIGALEIRAGLGISDEDLGLGKASRVSAGVGWIWVPNRASRFRLSVDAAVESGATFIGASFEATYGFLDVGFVGQPAYGAVK